MTKTYKVNGIISTELDGNRSGAWMFFILLCAVNILLGAGIVCTGYAIICWLLGFEFSFRILAAIYVTLATLGFIFNR